MNAIFAAIEQTPLSIWMRDDGYAYFLALIFHALGMALLIGAGIVVSLCMLGAARGVELDRIGGFFRVMAAGAILASLSGLLLLVGYPAKALTNPVFGVKLACLIAATLLMRAAARRLLRTDPQRAQSRPGGRTMAALALLLWLAAVAAGKLLLHTATVLTVT